MSALGRSPSPRQQTSRPACSPMAVPPSNAGICRDQDCVRSRSSHSAGRSRPGRMRPARHDDARSGDQEHKTAPARAQARHGVASQLGHVPPAGLPGTRPDGPGARSKPRSRWHSSLSGPFALVVAGPGLEPDPRWSGRRFDHANRGGASVDRCGWLCACPERSSSRRLSQQCLSLADEARSIHGAEETERMP